MWGFAMNLGTGANAFLLDDVEVYEQVVGVEDFEGPRTVSQRNLFTFNGGGWRSNRSGARASPTTTR
jgi:hypothetical protein